MNYYPFHAGDYLQRTAHLTPIEDLAYRRLIDLYYADEAKITGSIEQIARKLRLREYAQEVEAVLAEFFCADDDGWLHDRCEEVIAEYRERQAKASEAGKKSAAKREAKRNDKPSKAKQGASKAQANDKPSGNASATPVKPDNSAPATPDEQVFNDRSTPVQLTNNQKPKPKDNPPVAPQGAASDEAFARFWQEYPKRFGGNSKANAEKAWGARIREGASPDDLIEAARRYRQQQEALGKVGTEYVKQAATFLGPAGHWQDALTSETAPVRPAQGVHHAATHQGMTDLSWMRDKSDDQ